MNTEVIVEVARATLAGTMSLPEVVGNLIGAGVEYYHVDYVVIRMTFYGAGGDVVVTPITYEGMPGGCGGTKHLQGFAGGDFGQPAQQPEVSGFHATRDGGGRAGVSVWRFYAGNGLFIRDGQGILHTEWFPELRQG